MKKAFVSLSLCVIALIASAQKTINSPRFGASNVKDLSIEKVILTDTATQVFFRSTYPGNTWFRISDKSYLTAGNTDKLMAKGVTGIAFNKEVYNKTGPTDFTISFPPVKASTPTIDYIEGDCENCFRILNIDLSGKQLQSQLPEGFYANWFNNKQWVLGINRNRIVYNSQVWDYKVTSKTASRYNLSLKKGELIKAISLQQNAGGELVITDNPQPKLALTSIQGDKKETIANDAPFTTPVLKSDTAVLSGYLKNYSPKLGYKTGNVIVNDVISSKQNSYVFNIAADGSFTAKVPMHYPEQIYFDVDNLFMSVFLAPGKKLFQYVDMARGEKSALFMGEYAALNREITAAHEILDLNYNAAATNAEKLSLSDFKIYLSGIFAKNLAKIDEYGVKHGLSAKARQLIDLAVKYRITDYLLSYNRFRETAYRKSNNVSNDQYESSYKPVDFDAEYLSLLSQLHVNDETSLLANDYSTFVNRIEYLDGQVFRHYNGASIRYYIDAFKITPPINNAEQEIFNKLTAALTDANITLASVQNMNKTAFKNFVDTRKSYFANAVYPDFFQSRETVIHNLVKTDISFTMGIIKTQELAQEVVRELKPADAVVLASFKTKLHNQAVFNAFEQFNNDIKAKIKATAKNKRGFVRNAIPKTSADSVFNTILSKYKGKAIYVDFWATWCGPCRADIEEIAPLKEELKGENIAFVYITDPSSPEDTYKKMIPGIAGEHYKLNKDEWNYIAGKYSISGIPRYMIVNKNGVIVNDQYNGWGGTIKTDLMKLAKE